MNIRTEDRMTKTIHCVQEKGDPNYGACLWADFTIGADRLSLEIQSDGGNMQYTWSNIGDDTPGGFYRFLAKLSREYFLRKMSNETRFNFDGTVKRMLSWLEDSRPELAKEVRDMRPCSNEHEFAAEYLAFPGSHTDDLECVDMDYPAGHKAVADIFCSFVQPRLLACISPKADAYFLEVGAEEDFSPEQLSALVAKLDTSKLYFPVQVDGDSSVAIGFVEAESYEEFLCDDNGAQFSKEMHEVLADVEKESPDGLYTFAEVRTHLKRISRDDLYEQNLC